MEHFFLKTGWLEMLNFSYACYLNRICDLARIRWCDLCVVLVCLLLMLFLFEFVVLKLAVLKAPSLMVKFCPTLTLVLLKPFNSFKLCVLVSYLAASAVSVSPFATLCMTWRVALGSSAFTSISILLLARLFTIKSLASMASIASPLETL